MTSPFSFAAFQSQQKDPPVGPRRSPLSFSAFEEQRRQEEERQREAGRSRGGVLPTVTTTRPAPTVAEKAGQFARGTGLGATQSLTSLGEVAGMVPGLGIVGEKARELEQKAAAALDPQGPYGLGGQVLGRMAGEMFQAVKAAGPVAKGIARIAPRAGQAIQAGLEGTRLQRALATAATSAPIDVVQGLKEEEGLLLPGRAGSVAENVLFSGGAGALFRGKPSPRTSVAPQPLRELPAGPIRDRARLLGAGPDAPMQGPAIPMGGATPGAMQGPAIPMRGVRPEVERITDPSRLLGGGSTVVGRSLEAAETGQPFAATLKRGEGKNFGERPAVSPEKAVQPIEAQAPIVGQSGRATTMTLSDGSKLQAQYKIVDAESLISSHSPSTFQADPRYPANVQGRDYAADKAAQAMVRSRSLSFDPDLALDASISADKGPPLITPQGVVVAGNERSMLVRLAQEVQPQRYEAYRQALAARAGEFGLTPEQVRTMRNPVLVREMADPSIAPGDTRRLAEINRLSDTPDTKVKRSQDDAASRAAALRQADDALQHFAGTMKNDETLAEYLVRADGKEFVRRLVEDNVVAKQEMARYMDPSVGTLTEEGRNMVRRMMLAAAVDRPDVAPASILLKLEKAVPSLVAMRRNPEWDLSATMQGALDVLGDAQARGMTLDALLSQTSAFDDAISPDVAAMAKFLQSSNKQAITDRMRTYAVSARESLNRAESIDVFGEMAASPLEAKAALTRVDVPRRGRASPELVTQLGTTGAGAAIGAATTPEGEPDTLIGRTLAGALAGYGVGRAGLAGARRLGGTPDAPPRGSTPAMQTVNATINTGDRAVADVPAWLTKKERAYTNLVSETRPLELAAAQGGQKSAMQGAISQAQGSGQAALQYLRDRVQLPIAAAKGQLDDVRALVKARRDLDIRVKGGASKSTVPTEVLEQAVRDGEANEAVRNAADALRDVERDLLRMRYEAGMLTDEAYQAIVASEDFYTPFVREFAEDAYQQMGAKGGKWYQRTSGVRRMDRTVDAISQTADPLEVATASVTRTFRDVGRQRVQNILGDLVEDGSLANVIRVVPENAPTNDAARVFKQVRGGKQVTYEVLDPELFDAIAAQGKESSNILLRVAQAMKNVKTAGITIEPSFAAGNVTRDVAASGIQRPDVKRAAVETGLGALGGGALGAATGDDDKIVQNFLRGAGFGAGAGGFARPFAQSLSAMGSIISANLSDAIARGALPANETAQTLLNRGAQSYREFLRSGASTEGFYVRTPKDAREVLQRLGAEERASIITPKRWWETLQAIGSVAEQSTRLAAFKQVQKAGASLPQAAREAQDRTLRFSNVGKATKGLASVTPFWNAKIQGWDKLVRILKQPKTWGLGTAMLTAPSVSLWNLNKDNPEYWERPIWERNLFWLVPKDEGGFYRIPKPFEIGYLFASTPERALDYLAQQGILSSAAPATAEPGRAAGRAAMDMATSTFAGTLPVPQILSLPGQLATNRDLFRNRPIVSRPGLPTEMQATPETSAIARQAAKFGISPEKVDFALRDVAGTTGREALRAVDVVAGSFGAPAPRMDRLSETPVVGQMQRRFTTQERGQTESEITARDRLRKIETVVSGMRELQRGGDQTEMRAYFEQNKSDLILHEQLRELGQALDQITADRRTVERNRDLPKEERERLLRAIREAGTRVSQQINQMPSPR